MFDSSKGAGAAQEQGKEAAAREGECSKSMAKKAAAQQIMQSRSGPIRFYSKDKLGCPLSSEKDAAGKSALTMWTDLGLGKLWQHHELSRFSAWREMPGWSDEAGVGGFLESVLQYRKSFGRELNMRDELKDLDDPNFAKKTHCRDRPFACGFLKKGSDGSSWEFDAKKYEKAQEFLRTRLSESDLLYFLFGLIHNQYVLGSGGDKGDSRGCAQTNDGEFAARVLHTFLLSQHGGRECIEERIGKITNLPIYADNARSAFVPALTQEELFRDYMSAGVAEYEQTAESAAEMRKYHDFLASGGKFVRAKQDCRPECDNRLGWPLCECGAMHHPGAPVLSDDQLARKQLQSHKSCDGKQHLIADKGCPFFFDNKPVAHDEKTSKLEYWKDGPLDEKGNKTKELAYSEELFSVYDQVMGWCHRVLGNERVRGGISRVEPEPVLAASTSSPAPSSSDGAPGGDPGSRTTGSGEGGKHKERGRAELARAAVYPDQIKQIAVEILVHFGVNLQKRLPNRVIRVLIDRFRVAMRKAIAEAGAAATGFVAAVRLSGGCGADDDDADGAPAPVAASASSNAKDGARLEQTERTLVDTFELPAVLKEQTLELFSVNAEDRDEKVTLDLNAHTVLSRANSKAVAKMENQNAPTPNAAGLLAKAKAGVPAPAPAPFPFSSGAEDDPDHLYTSRSAKACFTASDPTLFRMRDAILLILENQVKLDQSAHSAILQQTSGAAGGPGQASSADVAAPEGRHSLTFAKLYKGAATTASAARRALVTDSEGVIEAYTRPADLPLELRERIIKQESQARRRKTLRYRPAGASLSRSAGGAAAGPPTLAGTMLRGLSLWRQLTDGFKPVVERDFSFGVDASANDARAERARNNYAHVTVAPYRALRPEEPEMKHWQTHLFAEVVVRQIQRTVDAIAELSDRFSSLRWDDVKGLSRYASSELGTSGSELFGDKLVYVRESQIFEYDNKIGSRRVDPGKRSKTPTSAWRKPWNRPQSETNEKPLYRDPDGRYVTRARKQAGGNLNRPGWCSPMCGRPEGSVEYQKGADRGECDACDGDQGTRGACCKRNEASDPAECRLPGIHWQYPKADYAQCVLLPGRKSPRKYDEEHEKQASPKWSAQQREEAAHFVDPIGAVMFAGYGPGGVFFPSVGGKR
eukprot:g17833.t1